MGSLCGLSNVSNGRFARRGAMSYRSLKRVLGETNLERKCRILFGLAIGVLIGAAFWGVDTVAENLVKNETRRKGRDSVDLILLKRHWDMWETDRQTPEARQLKALQQEISQDLLTQHYKHEILTLDDKAFLQFRNSVKFPEDEEETRILETLLVRLAEQQKAAEALPKPATPPVDALAQTSPHPTDPALETADDIQPIFEERPRPDQGVYYYYQPVYWKQSCARCHVGLQTPHAVSAAEATEPAPASAPFRVVKVMMPYQETRAAINSSRAILFTAAIALVSLSMIALYLIVKYVIVKPLQHLRDVSENISRGDTSLRADIHTNDEFEELAESFNKMLRSLTDQEAQLRTVNLQLDGKLDQLAQMNVRLYEMNRVKSDFLANMSHELRTPLNSIIGFSEVLQGVDLLTEKQKRYAQNIQKSGRLLLEMINDILDLAKMEAGRMEVRPTEFRGDAIVHAGCDMVRSLTEEKNIDLVVNVASDLPPLYQDQAKLQQILTNLLSNAIKFTPDGGRIVVSAGPNERGLFELSVADTGVGIAEQDREIIFEKFRQGTTITTGDGLTREYSGTGLGLSIVRELCKLLGGEITFDSELGKGSTFRIHLPWVITQLPRPESPLTARIDDLTKPRRADYREPAPAT
jgi:two-component system sensor histidine kinase BarA